MASRTHNEALVSVDVEASGPTPGNGSLIAIGACLVERPAESFYRELQPIPGLPWDDEAERIHRLSREHLAEHGMPPAVAMADLAKWLDSACNSAEPVFVGFNAAFDWMFVADYCWRFLGHNPFGHAPLDLKSLYMGREGVARWSDTTKGSVVRRYPVEPPHTHQALDDARMQAALAVRLLHDER